MAESAVVYYHVTMPLTGLRPGATPQQIRRTARVLIVVAVCMIAADVSTLLHHRIAATFAVIGLTCSVVIVVAAAVMLRRLSRMSDPDSD